MAHDSSKDFLKLPKKSNAQGDLPDSIEGWTAYVNEVHDSALLDRKKQEYQWVRNIAYYHGTQNLLYMPRSGLIEFPKEDTPPIVINRIGSFIEARHAKLTKSRPVARVIPDTNDLEDVRGATNQDHALLHLWRKIGMEREYDKLVMLGLLCGTSFIRTLWDPFEGDRIYEPKRSADGEDLLLDEDGTVAEEEIFLGEVSSKALSAFQFLPGDDSIEEIRDQPWLLERNHLSIVEIEKLYPHLRGEIQKEDRETSFTEYEKLLQRVGSPLFQNMGYQTTLKRDSLNSRVVVKNFWMKPNYQYEQGVVAVVVGKKMAMIDVWPHDYGRNIYPYVKWTEKEDGLRFWQPSSIERVIPIQQAINRLKSKKLRHIDLMANGKYLSPKGAMLSPNALDDDSGEVVEYNPAVPKPEQMAFAPLPNFVPETARELIVDFRDVVGQREASITPTPNVTASIAMQTQAELSEEVIKPILERLARAMTLVANQQLLLMNEEWKEARKIKILGEGGKTSVQWMSHVDLRHSTDVHIEVESMFPDLRGSKRQVLIDLWDRRIIDDPKKILRSFRYGNFDALLEEDEKLEETVFLDIARIKKGKTPEIHPFQNHLLYVRELTKWIQQPEFLRLIPERKQLALQVLQMHLGMVMQQMPNLGEPMPQTNPAALGTPSGPQKTVGSGSS